MVVDHGADTGPRLKLFSRAADVDYWTERWQTARDVSYERERRGHLPHQLRTTWKGLSVRARRGYVATPLPRPKPVRTGG